MFFLQIHIVTLVNCKSVPSTVNVNMVLNLIKKLMKDKKNTIFLQVVILISLPKKRVIIKIVNILKIDREY